MRYQKLGNSGIDVSVIGHGTWKMGNDFFGEVDEKRSIDSLHASVDMGVNLIDTAPAYGANGDAEVVVGKAIKGIREKVVLATKVGILRLRGHYIHFLNPDSMRVELEDSLRRLDTDYIDLYQIHWPDYNNSTEEALETMLRFKEEGKIRAIGVSNFSTDEIRMAEEIAGICAVQPPLSMLERSSIKDGILDLCYDKNIATLTYGSLGGGILGGTMKKPNTEGKEKRNSFYNYYEEPMWSKCQELLQVLKEIADERNASVAQVAINWSLAQKGVTCALMGASAPQTAIENAKAADWELSIKELETIEKNYQRIMG